MRRTVFIGDVHGCAAELRDLLSKVGLTSDDRVVFVGDLVARGPDSRGVLALARELAALAVRGNHEERLLAARKATLRGEPPPKIGKSHAALARELDEAEWRQLEALPLNLDFPEHSVRVVHAGVVPRLSWEEQDPWMVTHMRSLLDDGSPSDRWGTPWGATYQGPLHVVFGHNAQRAPQIHAYATGIDTACVYGGALTALVLSEGQAAPPVEARRDALVSVPARAAYHDYGRELPGG
ncbi:MAG: metallophosphoesterase family protein [Polyangiaceae bacterium]